MSLKRLIFIAFIFSVVMSACAGGSAGNDLEGSAWVLTSLDGASPISGGEPTLIFENGIVRGNASCNQFGGGYQIKGDSLVFAEAMEMTAMACLDQGIMEQEQAYMRLLSGEMRFEITDGQMSLTNQQGNVLIFRRSSSES